VCQNLKVDCVIIILSLLPFISISYDRVVGANEFATGQHSLKTFKAITKVKMHHLRFSDLTKIEEEDPSLVLRLYKMLTYVMARKEEDTVSHLSTLHDILSSPAHSKPISRLSIRPLSQT
jgi:hypothetical protein